MPGPGTQYSRTELGMSSSDHFMCFVICKLGWDFTEIERDLKSQFIIRGCNARLADDLTRRIMERLRKRFSPKKIKDSISGAIDTVKKFELSPMTIAKIAYGTMGALAQMALDAADCGMDRNRYHFGDDAERDQYLDYLIYTYTCNGHVQPRYRFP